MVRDRLQRGFTLMEMLIVIAIIAVLVAIAIPVFSNQLEQARRSTDLANMRSAYASAMTEWMSGDARPVYYFTGSGVVDNHAGIAGYGQSETDASEFSQDLPVPASGRPRSGDRAGYIVCYMGDAGVDRIMWTGGIGGVHSASEYNALTAEQKRQMDIEMLDGLQDAVRNMTYGDIRRLIAEGRIRTETAFGGRTCFKIASSCIDDDGNIVLEKNGFVNDQTAQIFRDAGYDVSVDADKMYLFTSSGLNTVTAPLYEVTIWVDVGRGLNGADDDAKAENTIVYINDNGKGKHEFNHPARAERG